MRWDALRAFDDDPTPTLPRIAGARTRTFDTPAFRDITCHEVRAKSILNRVPAASQVPFRWTVNPYRGCAHACVYCFARNTHTYLGLDAGLDFERQLIVKVNAGELLRKELAAPRWAGEHVAMGTNVDPYQRVEGRYRLMREIISALRDRANPFSILTKGTLVLRDLDLLTQAAAVTEVSAAVSVGFLSRPAWRALEPGAPRPERRLEVCRTLRERGIHTSVLMAPIVPGLTDSAEELERTVAAIAEAGAASVTPIVLHLRPGAREWFAAWLAREHPGLRDSYRALYPRGSYAASGYRRRIQAEVARIAARHGLATGQARPARPGSRPAPAGDDRADRADGADRPAAPAQLRLL